MHDWRRVGLAAPLGEDQESHWIWSRPATADADHPVYTVTKIGEDPARLASGYFDVEAAVRARNLNILEINP